MGGAVGVQTTDPFIKGKKVKNPKRKKEEKKKKEKEKIGICLSFLNIEVEILLSS